MRTSKNSTAIDRAAAARSKSDEFSEARMTVQKSYRGVKIITDVLQARSERGSDTRLFNFQFSKQKMGMRLTSRAVSDLQ